MNLPLRPSTARSRSSRPNWERARASHFVERVRRPVTLGSRRRWCCSRPRSLPPPADRRRAVLCHELWRVRAVVTGCGCWARNVAHGVVVPPGGLVAGRRAAAGPRAGRHWLTRRRHRGAARIHGCAVLGCRSAVGAAFLSGFLRRRHLARRLVRSQRRWPCHVCVSLPVSSSSRWSSLAAVRRPCPRVAAGRRASACAAPAQAVRRWRSRRRVDAPGRPGGASRARTPTMPAWAVSYEPASAMRLVLVDQVVERDRASCRRCAPSSASRSRHDATGAAAGRPRTFQAHRRQDGARLRLRSSWPTTAGRPHSRSRTAEPRSRRTWKRSLKAGGRGTPDAQWRFCAAGGGAGHRARRRPSFDVAGGERVGRSTPAAALRLRRRGRRPGLDVRRPPRRAAANLRAASLRVPAAHIKAPQKVFDVDAHLPPGGRPGRAASRAS